MTDPSATTHAAQTHAAQAHADQAHRAIDALAGSTDPQAFQELLVLSAHLGQALGVAARNLATAGSWASVADLAGTSRQAAWQRWSR